MPYSRFLYHRQQQICIGIIALFIVLFNNTITTAQNAANRYEIDAKRIGVMPTDKDALPRSREFIRLDSTYYVGHMYEGMYKWDRSADYAGFKNATTPLRKAFKLIQKDFGKNLKSIYAAPENYMQYVNRYSDFLQIANALRECYSNIEMSDSVMWVLDQCDTYQFKKEHLYTSSLKAWTYHRDRFFTSAKFKFLKNSVAENEKMAFGYCYHALYLIQKNKVANDVWFGPTQSETDKQNVYHYLALLHCYNKNYDSSTYYYEKMRNYGQISWTNYGSMQHEVGNIANSIDYFLQDKYKSYQHFLREPYYYVPELYIYTGKTKESLALAREAVTFSKSSPGFGWYNIAMGRAFLYDNQLDSSAFVLKKAMNFKELHIGTTLTQSQYEFTINLLQLQVIERKMAQVKFVNDGWWYSPSALYQLAALRLEKMSIQYVLMNQLANNPERERIVYDLFCAESTITFDEALYLLKDLSPAYFQKKYKQYIQTDTRPNVQRYFKLAAAKFKWESGDEKAALKDYETLLKETTLDTANEKLFLGRLYEGLCKGYRETDDTENYQFYCNTLLGYYPQLIPVSGLKLNINLSITGANDDKIDDIIDDIKDANIKWTTKNQSGIPIAKIKFTKKGNQYEAILDLSTADGKTVVSNQKTIFHSNTKDVGEEIVLRLFGKGGNMVL
jgi:hypothetical protein